MQTYCSHCKALVDMEVSIKFIKTKQEVYKNPEDKRNPKWNFMLKATCKRCRGYIKFLPQTDDVIQSLQDKIFI